MKRNGPKPTRRDILHAFAVEPRHDKPILEDYLERYPEFSRELLDLSRELSIEKTEDTKALSNADRNLIKASLTRLNPARPSAKDVFASLDLKRIREIVKSLGIPQQVLTAFRERKVIPSTVPVPFLERLASVLGSSLSDVRTSLALPQAPKLAGSFKATEKPEATEPVTFEHLLIQAGVPEAKRVELLRAD